MNRGLRLASEQVVQGDGLPIQSIHIDTADLVDCSIQNLSPALCKFIESLNTDEQSPIQESLNRLRELCNTYSNILVRNKEKSRLEDIDAIIKLSHQLLLEYPAIYDDLLEFLLKNVNRIQQNQFKLILLERWNKTLYSENDKDPDSVIEAVAGSIEKVG